MRKVDTSVSERVGARVRKVDASTGVVTTIAGGGLYGFVGDGGPATDASIVWAEGMAFDASGNLYFSDQNGARIRKVTVSTGIITTIAGSGITGYAGDGGPATSAELNNPAGIAFDPHGNLYVGDSINHRVREINLKPVITWPTPAAINAGTAISAMQLDATANVAGTFAYTPAAGTVPAAGTDTLSVVFTPTDTTDYSTAVYSVLLAVNGPAPLITTVAGTGISGNPVNGIQASSAQLGLPSDIVFDSAGDYYVVASGSVQKVNASTGIITVIAGNGTDTFSGNGGLAINAGLEGPTAVALDASGNVYIAEPYANVIQKVTASTGIITIVAGTETGGYTGDGGPATSAELNFPWGITLDASGNLYIADSVNNAVREVSASTGIITTIAGTGTAGYAGDGGPATSAKFSNPVALKFDAAGNLYISDQYNSLIRKVSASTGIITTVAGSGPRGYIGDGGPATSANISWTEGFDIDAAGNLYFADKNNSRVRKVTASTGIITTIAGDGILGIEPNIGYSGDGGPATSAELNYPEDVALDPHGNVYVADRGNNRVREINLESEITWATPAPITYGTPLSGAQLNAAANVPGTFSYSPASGAVLTAGTDTLSVTFTPSDTTDYSAVTGSVALTVEQATPSVTWSTPSAINYGTALSSAQLDATASVSGSFVYSPAEGTVLPAGSQILSLL